jgi:lipopolysaccharide export system protein LptA
MIAHRVRPIAALAFAVALATVVAPAAAQKRNAGVPNAMQGFSQNRDQPVHIEAAALEVRDKKKVAIFSGDVRVVQGDTDMRCKSLLVYYEADPKRVKATAKAGAKATPAAKGKKVTVPEPGFEGQQRIRKLEARGGVVVKRNDQIASGKTGIFDMRSNTVTLVGDVVISQGPNVTSGDRLVVNLTTGVSRIESGKSNRGRVRALIQPSNANPAHPKPKPGPGRSRTGGRAVPGQPLRLN